MTTTDDELTFNGINAATGDYLAGPRSVRALAAAIRDETFARDRVVDLRARRDQALPDYGMVFGKNPEDLTQAGWAVIAATGADPAVLDALAPLFKARQAQAGDRFRRCTSGEGYRPGETKREFLARFGTSASAPVNPDRFPYYVLLVGGPQDIPFDFQYQLDVQYAVGRLGFDTAQEYAFYAAAAVAAEAPGAARAADVALFGPRHPADRATQLSASQLVTPLQAELAPPGGAVRLAVGDDADKAHLLDLLCGAAAPSLLFTAGHGVAYPPSDPRQQAAQGALLCQDWPGPLLWRRPLPDDFAVTAADIPDAVSGGPAVVMAFACYGAGTPAHDDYAHLLGTPPEPAPDAAFLARLPQRLLAHPAGRTLAFVGHVERAWGCSFVSPGAGTTRETFWSALQSMLVGHRVGHAMEFFDDRYAAVATELGELLDSARRYGTGLDDQTVAGLWTENNDARSYVVLGDPAVRIPGTREEP